MNRRLPIQVFSIVYIAIFSLLHVHPIYIEYGDKKARSSDDATPPTCTQSKKPLCSRNKCTLPLSADGKEDCNNNGCNPCVPCSAGFCCYLVEAPFSYGMNLLIPKQYCLLVNDNRTQNSLSECWHPPEFIS